MTRHEKMDSVGSVCEGVDPSGIAGVVKRVRAGRGEPGRWKGAWGWDEWCGAIHSLGAVVQERGGWEEQRVVKQKGIFYGPRYAAKGKGGSVG